MVNNIRWDGLNIKGHNLGGQKGNTVLQTATVLYMWMRLDASWPNSIIPAVIWLEPASGSWILKRSNPLVVKEPSEAQRSSWQWCNQVKHINLLCFIVNKIKSDKIFFPCKYIYAKNVLCFGVFV